MRQEKVSVIVPVYNVERYLRECLDSIIAQTYRNMEIILVDDGSKDLSGKICDEYQQKDCRIQVIHKENQGLSLARKSGVDQARGSYVVFVDSDDYVSKSFVETQVDELEQTKADMVVTGFQMVKEGRLETTIAPGSKETISSEEMQERFLRQEQYVNSMWNKLYRMQIIKEVEFPSEILFEDFAVIYKIIEKCRTVRLSTEILYFYRLRENSIMTQEFSLKKLDLLKNCDEMKKYMEQWHPDKYKLIAYCDMYCCFTTLRRMVFSKNRYKAEENEIRNRILKNIPQIAGMKGLSIRDAMGIAGICLGVPVFKRLWIWYERLKNKRSSFGSH